LKDAEVNIVGSCMDGSEVLSVINKTKTDVVLVDILMKNVGGRETVSIIKNYDTNIKIIGMSFLNNKCFVDDMFSRGAESFLLKEEITPEALITEIKKVMNLN